MWADVVEAEALEAVGFVSGEEDFEGWFEGGTGTRDFIADVRGLSVSKEDVADDAMQLSRHKPSLAVRHRFSSP